MVCRDYGSVWFSVSVVSVLSITHLNGLNISHIKVFPKVGENVTLKCNNFSNNNSQSNKIIKHPIEWRMHHRELPGRAKVLENGDLFISPFNPSDAGIFICVLEATNTNTYIEYEVKPRSEPGSLLDVKVIPYSVLMLITWKDIEHNGGSPILNITIRYRSTKDQILIDSWNVLKVDPFKAQKEIYSLSPNTLYEVQIWACNELGNGPKTELAIRTRSEMTDIELEKRLMEGIDTFDSRAWTFAVIVIMSTFSIFGIALCCLFVNEPRMQKCLEDSEDVERIELIPNITINPGYCET